MARIRINPEALFKVQDNMINEGQKVTDSLRVVEAIQDQVNKTQTNMTKDILTTDYGIKQLTPELTENALEIQNLKEDHRDLTKSYDKYKIKIDPYTFNQYADPFEQDDGFEYGSGEYMRSEKFTNTGGEYTIKEAEDIVFDLDKQISELHVRLDGIVEENKSSAIFEEVGVYGSGVTRTEMLMSDFDNYPKLFTYLLKGENVDDYGNSKWTNHLTMNNSTSYSYSATIRTVDNNGNPIPASQQGWYDKPTQRIGKHLTVDSPFLDSRLMERGTNVRSFTYEGFPAGVENPGYNDNDGYVGEGDKVAQTWGEWSRGEYDPIYSESGRRFKTGDRTDVLYNRETAIVEKLVDMQWLLLQKHKILCQTDGNQYCDLLQGESRDADLLNEVIANDNRVFETEQKIQELGGSFNNMKDIMSSNLGFAQPDKNLNSEDIISVQLDILNKAMDDLKKKASTQNDLYITEGMVEFVDELKNNPEAMLELFHKIVKK